MDICASDQNPRKVLIMISRPITWVQRQLYQVAVFQSILIITLPSAGTDLISTLWIASPFYRRPKHRLVAYPLIGSSKFMPLIVDGWSIAYSKMMTMMVWWWWLMVSSVGYQCSLSDVVCLFHDGVWKLCSIQITILKIVLVCRFGWWSWLCTVRTKVSILM